MEPPYTVSQAAEVLGIHYNTLTERMRCWPTTIPPFYNIGRRYFFARATLANWVKQQEHRSQSRPRRGARAT